MLTRSLSTVCASYARSRCHWRLHIALVRGGLRFASPTSQESNCCEQEPR